MAYGKQFGKSWHELSQFKFLLHQKCAEGPWDPWVLSFLYKLSISNDFSLNITCYNK